MKTPMHRYAAGVLAAGTLIAGAAVASSGPRDAGDSWTPVTAGLTEDPGRLLPTEISTAEPVSVVSTVLDDDGRPVVSVGRATDRAEAERLVRAGQQAHRAVAVEIDAPVTLMAVPDGTDPYRSLQWDFTKLNVATAWQRSTGAGVTVAVIDSGVQASHPDLAGQVLPGIDLVADTSGVSTDPNGHGTHVAGTIAARTGNGAGVSAIAPDVRILPIRTLDASGVGVMSDVATGIVYAADQGAQVINMSLGSTVQVTSVSNAIGYARSKGVVVVAAAGNYRASGSPTLWPAADAGVVAVASTDENDAYSSFSNRGSYVDVAAPGSSILSTVPSAGYAYYNGTSMAAPHVAAAAALVAAYRPGLTPDQVELALTGTATDLGAAGRDSDFGHGRINPAAALASVAPASATPSASTPAATPGVTPSTAVPTTTPPATVPPTSAVPTTPVPTTPVPTTPAPTTKPPTSAPAKVTPVVTSTAVSQVVPYGAATSTTFTVTAQGTKWAGRPVSICTALWNRAFECVPGTTSSAGTFRYTRATTAWYQVRLMVTATATSNAVTSKTYTYTPRAAVQLRKSGRYSATAAIGGTAGQTVQVQRLDGGHWVTVLTYRAAATFTLSGLRARSAYRIVVPSTPAVAGAQSGVLRT
ncbi:S8 family serine peptidase [Jidongwangia harbinensis]|uniref:S8 family serine peptidase n=1 Tax=Jidongwangia harbinensis TaxID=2878561 RepID=UPI001CD9BDD0|nr:S8 family serine peptidase [Jidongwangia harbinensis]MCA2214157.1 S8 family serine peptidase [Jidongwangia harbinensis]